MYAQKNGQMHGVYAPQPPYSPPYDAQRPLPARPQQTAPPSYVEMESVAADADADTGKWKERIGHDKYWCCNQCFGVEVCVI